MTIRPPILRNSLLALPVLVAGAALSGGVVLPSHVALAGISAVANLAVFAWLSGRFIQRVVADGEPGFAGVLVSTKLLITVPLFALLMRFLTPLATVVGFSTVVLGVAITGLSMAFSGTTAPMMES